MGDYPGPFVANGSNELILRRATKADLDDITRVAQAGFPDDPEFNYRFPYRHKFPEDNWKWTRREYAEYLEQPQKFAVLVVTAPVVEDGRTRDRPIALAVWDMAVLKESTSGGIHGAHARTPISPANLLQMVASTSVATQTLHI